MTGMSEETLMDAIMNARAQVDFLWQFFVTVHIAIFALLLLYNHAVEGLNWPARLFAVAGIGSFEWINGNALSSSYLVLDSMHDQYRMVFGQAERFHPSFYQNFVLSSYDDRPSMVLMTHGAALIVVLLAFVSSRFLQTHSGRPTRDAGMPRMWRD